MRQLQISEQSVFAIVHRYSWNRYTIDFYCREMQKNASIVNSSDKDQNKQKKKCVEERWFLILLK